MPAEYKLQVKNAAGSVQAELYGEGGASGSAARGGFLYVSCAKGLNVPGEIDVVLNATSDAAQYLVDKAQLSLYRRWPELGVDWYSFFSAIVRDDMREMDDDGVELLSVRAYGPLHMLGWRATAYPSGTSNKTTWSAQAVEKVVKDIVTTNFTTSATTGNGRDRNGTSAATVNGYTVTIETNSNRGASIELNAARVSCLRAIQDALSTAGTGDVDLIQTGPATFDFRFYPLRGSDKTSGASAVIFDPSLQNMRRPKLARARSEEQTAIIVAGGGQGVRRAVVVRTGTNYSTTNDIEYVANGATTTGGSTSTSVLNGIGDKEKTKRRMRAQLEYEILQTPAALLDVDYSLGDLVLARYAGQTFTQQIAGVSTSWKAGELEDLRVEVRDYGA
ncbi:MAG: hypothetical protein IPO81_09635 [Kouleothrix sp.]|nr:hypothetical protein [Kouleothrix sp.]